MTEFQRHVTRRRDEWYDHADMTATRSEDQMARMHFDAGYDAGFMVGVSSISPRRLMIANAAITFAISMLVAGLAIYLLGL